MTAGRTPWRVVVAGGGFAGLYAASYLACSFDLEPEDEVLLLDARNHFTFTPLLPEVAAGTLGREHVSVPYRRLASKHGFRFLQAEVRGLDPETGRLHTTAGPVDYDRTVLALGSRARFFGNEELRRRAFPMKTVADALRLRDRVIGLCEAASGAGDAATRRQLLTFVVAGAGPAGVETASELHDLLREVLARYYPSSDAGRVVLVEGGDRILNGWDETLAREGRRTLEDRGIELRLNTRVEDADDEGVELSDGGRIPTRTLVWTAGVAPHPLAADAGLSAERGAALVDEHLRARGRSEVYVVGDMARATDPRTGEAYPPVAPIAASMGVRAAGNVENDRAGRQPRPYRAYHAGKLLSLGAGDALVDVLGLRLSGLPAWLAYRTVYLLKLVGLRNKAQVAFTLGLNALFDRDLTTGWTAGDLEEEIRPRLDDITREPT